MRWRTTATSTMTISSRPVPVPCQLTPSPPPSSPTYSSASASASVRSCPRSLFVGEILMEEPRCLELKSPLYIFGDFHGNMTDLLSFSKVLWPLGMHLTPGSFLFLGDYVDRGSYSLEVFLLWLGPCLGPYLSVRPEDPAAKQDLLAERQPRAPCRQRTLLFAYVIPRVGSRSMETSASSVS